MQHWVYGQENPDFSYSLFKQDEGEALIEVTPENVAELYPNNQDILDLFFDDPDNPTDPVYIETYAYP